MIMAGEPLVPTDGGFLVQRERYCDAQTVIQSSLKQLPQDVSAIPRSKARRDVLRAGLLSTMLPLAAEAIDMNNAAGLRPDSANGLEGLDLEGLGPDRVDRNDKKAFERKMKAKQQGQKAPQDRREATKGQRAQQAAMAVFEDDVLGYAFAVAPRWEGSTQQLEKGGQIIAFSDKENPNKTTRVILVAQPSPVPTFKDLAGAIQPQGQVLSAETQEKVSGKDDGFVRVFDYESKGNRYTTLFSLRVKPQGSEENWLITLTTQTEAGMYEDYAKEFQSIFKSFRLLYPVVKEKPEFVSALSLPDEELGMPNKYIEMDPLLTFPFGGKEQEQLKVNRLAQFFQ